MRIYLRAIDGYRVRPYAGPTVLVRPQKGTTLQPESSWAWGASVRDIAIC